MNNNDKKTNGSTTKREDDPTSELDDIPVPAGLKLESAGALEFESEDHTTGVAGHVSKSGSGDVTIASLQSDLRSRAQMIGKLQFELQHLKTKSTGLEKELGVLEDIVSRSVAETKSTHQEHSQTKKLLEKRDTEVESLRSKLQAKERDLEESAQELRELKVAAQELTVLQAELEELRAVESRAKLDMEPVWSPEAIRSPKAEFDGGDRTDTSEDSCDLAMLVPIDGDASAQCAIKTGSLSLGSSPDNDIQIESDLISRHHAQIVSNSADSILKDLNSTNGTYVNSKRIKRHALRNGDSITVGRYSFRYVKKVTNLYEGRTR
jgi:hypothetical protein